MISLATYQERAALMPLVVDYAGALVRDFLAFSRSWEIPWALDRSGLTGGRGPLRILDAGCVGSSLASHLAGGGHAVSALDLPSRIGGFRSDPGNASVHGIAGDMRNIPARGGAFDVVLSISAIEHMAEREGGDYLSAPAEAVGELLRVLRPGGMLVVTFDLHASTIDLALERLFRLPLRGRGLERYLVEPSPLPGPEILDRPGVMVSREPAGRLERFRKRPWNSWEGRYVTAGYALRKP